MNHPQMIIADDSNTAVTSEEAIFNELLTLKDAHIVELGCGNAEKTCIIARQAAAIRAFEVDDIQLAKNLAITNLSNVTFARAGAEDIPLEDSSADIVMMFKSLHHVPIHLMDQAFSEIHRILKPGGHAYISEPIYAGDFNEILKLFHDERWVREAAFAAELRAASAGNLTLVTQRFFLQAMHFNDFAHFSAQVIGVSHSKHQLTREKLVQVHLRFDRHMTADGANFKMPIRVDLFKKPETV